MPEGPLPPFPTTGCGGAVAGVHSKCDRQGGNPWLAGGILASLAGLFDHLEEGLCWCGMDDDHAVAVTTKVLGAVDRKEVSVSAPSCRGGCVLFD